MHISTESLLVILLIGAVAGWLVGQIGTSKGSQAVPNFGEPQIQLKVLRLLRPQA